MDVPSDRAMPGTYQKPNLPMPEADSPSETSHLTPRCGELTRKRAPAQELCAAQSTGESAFKK